MKCRWKKIFSLLLCLCLLTTSFFKAYAEPSEENKEGENVVEADIHITTLEEFLSFGENCRLDTYSRGLIVALDCDLDLKDIDFQGIPTFGGTFLGNDHKITGLTISGEGSIKGLFRYLQETAVVQNLTVEGNVEPKGSGNQVGGFVGVNAGRISNCTFSGNISGNEDVGGIAGYNALTGIIENCQVEGNIHGTHFVGGVVGENNGVVRECANRMTVNTTAVENSVEISDITLDTITNSETVITITDVGGIAGGNCGVIRKCTNYEDVGYRQMGYNIGGIAGSQMGYIAECENFGDIQGRKEVGGIVGQMEPATQIKYEKDTLQMLQGDLNTMADLTEKTSSDMQNSSDTLSGQMSQLNTEAENAGQAIEILLGLGEEDVDEDTLLAARNNLSSSLSAMSGITEEMIATWEETTTTMSGNLNAIAEQMRIISNTIGGAEDGFGVVVKDVSDEDTSEDTTGKVEGCINYGELFADMTVGGIVGSIAMESDLDPEEDIDIIGETSLKSEIRLRVVVLRCENKGGVVCKKQYGGGIAGQTTMGLIRACANSGNINGTGADYIGGIAGFSKGYVRNCNVKCRITGAAYVGGILGTGNILFDSRSMVMVEGREKVGHIMGYGKINADITGNAYFVVNKDLGAVDGISYQGIAQPLSREEFFSEEELSELFLSVQITFVRQTEEPVIRTVEMGTVLTRDMIPAIVEKEGYVGVWEGVEEHVGKEIMFDYVFYETYTPYTSVISSREVRENDAPVLLVEGEFLPGYQLSLSPAIVTPSLSKGQSMIEGFTFKLPENEAGYTFRYLPPESAEDTEILITVYSKDGTWREVTWEKEGSYYIFHVDKGDTSFCIIGIEDNGHILLWIAGSMMVFAGCTIGVILWRKKKAANAVAGEI